MSLNDIDKTKIRTAAKCFLLMKKKATAKQIFDYILQCDLKLRGNLTTNELARELTYCSKTKNFVNLNAEIKKNTNTRYYYLEEKP